MADNVNRDPPPGDDVDVADEESVEEVGAKEDFHVDIQDYLEDLPAEVKRRIKALKKIQLEVTKVEAKFYEEMHALETKYMPIYQPFFEKRNQITNGLYEPNDDECDFGSDTECDPEALADELKSKLNTTTQDDGAAKVTGIPNFWLKIFHHVENLSEMMESYDEPILEHLTDIKVEATNNPMGFKLFFHFSPNEYFTNSVLTKSYEMKCEVDPKDPFGFEGPEIVKCTGCTIDWMKGKNVTVKLVRKKQKHKQRGSIRTVSKTITTPSFFHFFTPPEIPDGPDFEMDEETQARLTHDFEVGQYIRERIVPRAVLFFTGEALDEDYEEEEDDDEENDEEEDDDDEDETPVVPGNRGQRSRKGGPIENPQECKQQ